MALRHGHILTRSSQLYESRLLRIGSPMFHFGMLVVVFGHVIGLVIPQSWTDAVGLGWDEGTLRRCVRALDGRNPVARVHLRARPSAGISPAEPPRVSRSGGDPRADRGHHDIDSLLRPVYGHAKQGASYGHTKIAGKQILRTGLSPLITTISTEHAAPMITGARLRAGKTNSGKGAARMIAQAVNTARAAGVTGQILVRGDSAYGNGVVVTACQRSAGRLTLLIYRRRTTGPVFMATTANDKSDVRALALVPSLACPVAQHDRIQPTGDRNHLTNRRKARPENTQEKLGRPATRPCPPPETTATTLTAPHANR